MILVKQAKIKLISEEKQTKSTFKMIEPTVPHLSSFVPKMLIVVLSLWLVLLFVLIFFIGYEMSSSDRSFVVVFYIF